MPRIYRIEWTRPSGRVTRFDSGTRDAAERYAASLRTGRFRIVALKVKRDACS
jgi:hypothetical protein